TQQRAALPSDALVETVDSAPSDPHRIYISGVALIIWSAVPLDPETIAPAAPALAMTGAVRRVRWLLGALSALSNCATQRRMTSTWRCGEISLAVVRKVN